MRSSPVMHLIGSLLLAAATTFSHAAYAALNLQVSIETHNVSSKADIKQPLDSHEDLDVTLADEYVSVKSAQETHIFDFKKRRRIVLDNAAKSYVDYSLYDTVGFRAIEMQNREMLHEMLAGANNPGDLMATIDNEHILSLQYRSPAKIDEAVQGDDLVFSSGNRQLARWSRKGEEVTTDDAERFAKFLRYVQGGHPQVLSKLASGHFIPATLTFTFTEVWGTSSRTISVKALRHVDSNPIDLSSYSPRKGAPSSDGVDAILDQAASLMPIAMATAGTRFRDEVAKAFHDGRTLDAILGVAELRITTGQQLPPPSPEQTALLRADPFVQKFMFATQAKAKEAAAETVKTFVELRSHAPAKSYVLKMFEASLRNQLGDRTSAKTLFIDVLQGHPLLAGVYKDVGDILLAQYDTPRAWRCWDVGRRLAPQLGYFAAVNQYESLLVTRYPEYF